MQRPKRPIKQPTLYFFHEEKIERFVFTSFVLLMLREPPLRTMAQRAFRSNLNKILPQTVGDNLWADRTKEDKKRIPNFSERLSKELTDQKLATDEKIPLMDIIHGKVKHSNLDEQGLRKRIYTGETRLEKLYSTNMTEEEIKKLDEELDNLTGYSKSNIYRIKK